jgi:predicted O-methyltransferase YrrM
MGTQTPEELLGLARGFMEPRILLTAAELGIFDALCEAPRTVDDLAGAIGGADPKALTILLDALAAMQVLEKRGGAYTCAEGVGALLTTGSAASVLPMVQHAANLWGRWSELTSVVRGSRPAGGPAGGGDLRAFIGAMHVAASPGAPEIVREVDPGGAAALLDVGGGPGTYTIAFVRASPLLRATLFDRPPVIEMAREQIEEAGVADRVRLVGGDFYTDPLPAGHDLAFVSAIIHQNSQDQNQALFAKVFDALNPGGRIVVRDHVMDPDRTRPRAGAIFAVNMLTGTPGGNCYTFNEIRDGLTAAGFRSVRLVRSGEHMDAVVDATKP